MTRTVYTSAMFALAIGLAAAGAVSVWQSLILSGQIAEGHWGRVMVGGGNLNFAYAQTLSTPRGDREYRRTPLHGKFGVLSLRTGYQGKWRWVSLTLPVWMAVLVTLFGPAWALYRGPFLRRQRRKRGQCTRCGYALTGLLSARCPECGCPVEAGFVESCATLSNEIASSHPPD